MVILESAWCPWALPERNQRRHHDTTYSKLFFHSQISSGGKKKRVLFLIHGSGETAHTTSRSFVHTACFCLLTTCPLKYQYYRNSGLNPITFSQKKTGGIDTSQLGSLKSKPESTEKNAILM